MKSNKKIIAVLAGILIVLLVIVAGLFMNSKGENKKEEVPDSNNNTISTVEEMIEAEEPFTIETKYCDLYYPIKWEKQVETEIDDSDDVYKVQFFGKVEDKEALHLFDIVFGGEEGALIGHFSKDEEEIPVYVVGMEIEAGEDWTDEELDTIYTMQEDVNYIIGMLEKEIRFSY